jgi:deoxyribose-phosphate aldolase
MDEIKKLDFSIEQMSNALASIKKEIALNSSILEETLNCIDLTSLNTHDDESDIIKMIEKVNDYSKYYKHKNVAAICVYPNFSKIAKETLTAKNVNIAVVSAGFPSSQTFFSIKLAECELAVSKGANEVDIVISVGKFLNAKYQDVFNEIFLIKKTIGDAHLKVILETGILKNIENIYKASYIAMEAGADFIKTSTGKLEPAATPEAVFVMTKAIKDFHEKTGKKIGIKPAGGIVTPEDAALYYGIVKYNLGSEWLNNKLFRIGASRLANNILTELENKEVKYF